MLDMEARRRSTPRRVDPDLPLARSPARCRARPTTVRPRGALPSSGPDGTAPRPRLRPAARPTAAATRATSRTPRSWPGARRRRGSAWRCAGSSTRALRRTMLWDVQHAARTRELVPAIRGPGPARAGRARSSTGTRPWSSPAWPGLRAQAVHTDLTTDNVLVDDDGRITGIIDFGDLSLLGAGRRPGGGAGLAGWTAGPGTRSSAPPGWSSTATSGYTPLEPVELRLLGELVGHPGRGGRRDLVVAVGAGPRGSGFAERYNERSAETVDDLLDTGWDEVARRLGADVPPAAQASRRSSTAGERGPRPGARGRSLRRADPDGRGQRASG